MEIATVGNDPGLVERGPRGNAVAQCLDGNAGVLGKPVGNVAVEPAAPVVERCRKVPMVERRQRRDSGFKQGIDQPVVEGDAPGVGPAGAFWQKPAP